MPPKQLLWPRALAHGRHGTVRNERPSKNRVNRSSLSWAKQGTLPSQVCDLMSAAKASRGKEHVIIDTEAHPEEDELEALAKGCDLLVLPSTPDALALEALLATVDNLQNLTSYGVVLTMVDSRKKGTATQAKETLNRLIN